MTLYQLYGLEILLDDALLPEAAKRGLSRGWYEREEIDLIRAALGPGDRVLELGAGLGVTSMVAARKVGADCLVSFEANPLLLPIIRDNAQRNGLSLTVENRVLLPARQAATRQHVRFRATDDFWTGHVIPDSEACDDAIRVPTADFDATLAAFGANAIIMDIEGFEIDLLEDSALEGVDKIIVEIHYDRAGRDRTDAAIMALLQRGYRLDLQRSARGVLLITRAHVGRLAGRFRRPISAA